MEDKQWQECLPIINFFFFNIAIPNPGTSLLPTKLTAMPFKKSCIVLCFLLVSFLFSKAQIEVAHVSVKDFKATGFGAFLNFSFPASEANYITLEGGLQYFYKDEEDMALIPVLVGYRYTLNQTGTGFYVEPNAGYSFGASSIGVYENDSPVSDGNGNWLYESVKGPAAGAGFGYLFEPSGKIQFNLGLRYEHVFGNAASNLVSFRISHAFTFGRKRDD